MKKVLSKSAAMASAAAIMLTLMPYCEFGSMSAKAAGSVPEGFVYTEGAKFMCDDAPYYYGGTNCYYLTYKSQYSVDSVIKDCKDMGLNVIRIWGNLDAGTRVTEASGGKSATFINSVDGPGEKDGVYFQYFDSELNRPVINEGADGLRHLDYVITQAEKNNIKLIITFTNYWEAFGGMDQYIKWCSEAGLGDNLSREDFYTNETCKQWYKDYVYGLLNHTNYYTGEKLMDSEAVFAWELANEPRCEKSDAYCKNDILYKWAKEMSAYVKSIDPYHMVAVGDEGFYNYDRQSEPYKSTVDSDFAFSGNCGVDFDKLISIDTIDFGTPHFYCDSWSLKINGEGKNGGDDDMDWLKLHAKSAQAANKPVILEEFGLKDRTIRDDKYQDWMDLIVDNEEYEFQGFNYWMIASWVDDNKQAAFGGGKYFYTDYDQYTVYGPAEIEAVEGTPNARQILVDATAKMNKRNITNYFSSSSVDYDLAKGGDVKIKLNMQKGSFSSLTLDGKTLNSGSDYTYTDMGQNGDVSVAEITIKASVLNSLDLCNHKLKAVMSAGASPECIISVDDSRIIPAAVEMSTTGVDKNQKYPTDLSASVEMNGNSLNGISINGNALTENSDYVISGNTITFTPSFVKSLPDETAVLNFDFTPCKDVEVVLTIKDTTGEDVLDDFESYGSSDDVWGAYSRNDGGNEVSIDVVDKNGSKALYYGYNIDNPSYCGIMKNIGVRDLSAFKGISLWVQGDGSGNEITIQLRDANGNYWESYVKLDSTTGKTVQLPFSEFKEPSWQSSGSKMDTSKLNEFAIYAGGNTSVKSGVVYMDDICAYKDTPVSDNSIDSCSITLAQSNYTYDGTAKKPAVTVKDGSNVLKNGVDYTVSYKNNINAGKATVTISGIGSYKGSVSKSFTISAASLDDCTITLGASTNYFRGTRVKPVVTVKMNGKTVDASNFSLSYTDNLFVGTGKVTITGKNNFTGKSVKTFEIVQRSINNCNIVLDPAAAEFDGSRIKPDVSVICNGTTLYSGNYSVTYSNNLSVGTATVKITGKKNLKGTVTKTFKITQRDIKNCEVVLSKNAADAGKPTVTVKANGNEIYKGNYTVKYTSAGSGKVTVTITGKNNLKGVNTYTYSY